MIKHFCDCCGNEIDGKKTKINYLIHIDEVVKFGSSSYMDMKFNPTSGREESIDACIVCYNRVMTKAVKEMYEIKLKNQK